MSHSVVLLADVPGLGQLGDHKKVKDGYARNFLLPNKLAILATPNALKKFERQKEKLEAERQKQISKAKELAEKVQKVGLIFELPVGDGGRLFGSVTAQEIADQLTSHGASVEKRSILMNGPIKAVGKHAVRVRLHSQVIVDIPLNIKGIEVNKSKSEEEPEEKEETDKEKS